MPEVIASAANPLIKRVRLLADRRHRRRDGAFVVQGIQPVWQAVEAGADIEVLITAPELLPDPAAAMVAEVQARGVRVASLTGELFGRISDRDGPGGLAAIVRKRTAGLAQLTVRAGSAFVALHEVSNPGNLGTIIRTADAAGADGVILIGACSDPYDPAAVRASMGAVFSVQVATAATAADFLDWARSNGLCIVATSANAPTAFWEARLRRPLAILLGSEGAGLCGRPAAGDLRLRIPMTGTAESLNLAVAAGILLYEAWHQNGSEGAPDGRTES